MILSNQEILNRMNTQIERIRKYNELFDAAVTAISSEIGDMSYDTVNSFSVVTGTSSNYRYTVRCNDQDYNTIEIIVDNTATPELVRIASMTINATEQPHSAEATETYYNIPRSIRSEVYGAFTTVFDAVDEYNNNNEEE